MHIGKELKAMEKRMLTKELREEIYATYEKELELLGCKEAPVDFERTMADLRERLNEEQRALLEEMAELWEKSLDFVMHDAFYQGLYTGFEAQIAPEMGTRVAHERVLDRLETAEGMKQIPNFGRWRRRINELYEQLDDQLTVRSRRCLEIVDDVWEDRIYGLMRYGFYLGYRYALFTWKQVSPWSEDDELVKRTLMIEHELGLTLTWVEREWQGTLLPGIPAKRVRLFDESAEMTAEDVLECTQGAPLEALRLSKRVYRLLTEDEEHQIESVFDLLHTSDEELMWVNGMDEAGLTEIHEGCEELMEKLL